MIVVVVILTQPTSVGLPARYLWTSTPAGFANSLILEEAKICKNRDLAMMNLLRTVAFKTMAVRVWSGLQAVFTTQEGAVLETCFQKLLQCSLI